MTLVKSNTVAAELVALQLKMAALQARMQSEGEARTKAPVPSENSKPATPRACKAPKEQHRIGRVNIAPGITLTTLPGSMYSTMAKALASAGRLEEHDMLFNAFLRKPTADAALHLLQTIGMSREELGMFVRASEEFRAHCDDQTRRIKRILATGNTAAKAKAAGILKNSKICHSGRWIGDIDEGVSILSGARTLRQVRRGKNLRILNRAKLMFDTLAVAGTPFCFLYKQKWHRQFLQAVALVNP